MSGDLFNSAGKRLYPIPNGPIQEITRFDELRGRVKLVMGILKPEMLQKIP